MKTPFDLTNLAFKTFVESAPVLCLAADKNFITSYVNPFYKQVHNITLEEAVGKHIKDIIGEEGFNDNLAHYNKTLEGHIVEYHGSFNKLDGSIHHYKATYAPIYNGDEVVGITGVVLDITSEIEVEYKNKELERVNAEIEKARSDLTRLAAQDPLTSLYNRRYFTEISESLFRLAQRDKLPIAIVLMDVDDFKMINDTYGHKVGDNVLLSLADTLTREVRKSDVVCRFGGEEFIILLPETHLGGAELVAENLRSAIAATSVEVNKAVRIQFTVSIGVASNEMSDEHHLEHIIGRADRALYAAKARGKNQVILG